jgi:phage-related protein
LRIVGTRVDDLARFPRVAKFSEAVHVLHAFGKKSQRTPQGDIKVAARRYKEIAKR